MRSSVILSLLTLFCSAQQVACACNSSTHFDCLVGTTRRCVPLEWLCDNINDCEDGLDESHCAYLHHCPSGSMICRDGECVSQKFKCDGEADCVSGTDEVACHGEYLDHLRPTVESTHEQPSALVSPFSASMFDFLSEDCSPPKHQCRNNGPCLVRSAVCDGERDCPLGDDELNCTRLDSSRPSNPVVDVRIVCRENTMMCADEVSCVPMNWVCDGEKDCEDGSDELDCEDEVDSHLMDIQSNRELCKEDEYRCTDGIGSCISHNKTCDGVRDCLSGDDEGPMCEQCKQRACAHRCHVSSSGPRCYCPPGAELAADELHCSDIDECQTPEGKRCQHYCENGVNRFNCKCAPGYVLGRDGTSCRLERDQDGLLFVSLGNEVRSMPLFDPLSSHDSYEVAQSIGSHGTVRSADYVHRNNKLYLALTRGPREGELAVSSHGVLHVLRENVIGIGQVAVDWIGGNVYITQKYPSVDPGISVCSLNGFFCRLLVRGRDSDENDASKRQSYSGLALLPQRGLMFWIDTYNGHHKISMANMDGTNVNTLVDSKLEYPSGLTIDPIRGDVYFGDVEREMIEKVNFETRERHIVLTSGVHHPYDLVFYNGFLYWSDWGTETLKVSELSWHHSSAHVIHSFNRFPYGLTVNHSMYQLSPTHDPCQLISCHWMCVSVPNSNGQLYPQCICPNNYTPHEESCLPNTIREDNDSTSFISPAIMREYCEANIGCLNGGTCEERVNQHGRVDRIYCSCSSPFEGDHCETLRVRSPLIEEETESSNPWMALLFAVFFLALLAALFYIAYQKSETFSSMTKSAMERVAQDVSSGPPLGKNIRERVSTLVQSFKNAPLLRTVRSQNVSPMDIRNPLFVETAQSALSDDGAQTYASTASTSRSMLQESYSNPLFSERPSTAAPFSGIEVTYSNKFVH